MLADITIHARSKLPVIAPWALEALKQIDAIFDIEREINGRSADERLLVRRRRVVPLVEPRGLDAGRAGKTLPACRSR